MYIVIASNAEHKPVPVAARSKTLACSSWVSIPPGVRMFVCYECCVLSGRGLCDELITRPDESYRLCCVVVCDLETSRMRRPWPALGRSATEKNKTKEVEDKPSWISSYYLSLIPKKKRHNILHDHADFLRTNDMPIIRSQYSRVLMSILCYIARTFGPCFRAPFEVNTSVILLSDYVEKSCSWLIPRPTSGKCIEDALLQ
jgi:hypothetical protein